MEKEYDFEDLLKDRLFDAALQPELRSFDAIMYRLRKERRKKFLWFFFTGCFMIVLLGWGTWRIGHLHTGADRSFANTANGDKKHFSIQTDVAELRTKILQQQKNSVRASSNTAGKTTGRKRVETKAPSMATGPDGNDIQRSKFVSAPPVDLFTARGMPITAQAEPSENSAMAPREPLLPESLVLRKSLLAQESCDTLKIGAGIESTLRERDFFKRRFYVGPFVNAVFEKNLGEGSLKSVQSGSSPAFHFVPAYGLQGGLDLNSRWQIFLRFGTLTRQVDVPVVPVVFYSNFNSTSAAVPQTEFSYKAYGLEMSRVMGSMRFSVVRLGLVAEMQVLRQDDHTNSQLKRQFLSVGIKAGFVEDLGRHLEFRLSPNLNYSITGLNQYGTRQRPLAAGVEGTLLLKINP